MVKASEPADTRMMGIVHGALVRDLRRAHVALTTQPYPRARQSRALGEHVVWLMEFLHAHHTSEDEGLWPAVRAKNPAADHAAQSIVIYDLQRKGAFGLSQETRELTQNN